MKMIFCVFVCLFMLSGCGATKTLETINDENALPAMADAAEIQLCIPEGGAAQVFDNGIGGRLYMCDGYTVTVQTLEGGDLRRTIETASGFDMEKLTLIKTEQHGYDAVLCAWSAVGEGEDQVCRAMVLDDGCYHYVVTVMANYKQALEQTDLWQSVLGSVNLNTD